jgi:hypothetical protein
MLFVSVPVRLAQMRRGWPWGLAFLRDAESSDPLARWTDTATAQGTRTEIAAAILHEIDGQATAEVWLGEAPDGLVEVHEQELDVPSGAVVLGDAADEQTTWVAIPAGVWRARVLVDNEHHSELVVFVLAAMHGMDGDGP